MKTLKDIHISEINQIISELKHTIIQRYPMLEMRLFGSSARGDITKDSDIDIFIRMSEVNRFIEEELFDIAYDFELRYGCLIDIIVLADSTLKKYSEHIPIYQNILREGITV